MKMCNVNPISLLLPHSYGKKLYFGVVCQLFFFVHCQNITEVFPDAPPILITSSSYFCGLYFLSVVLDKRPLDVNVM